MFITIEGVIGAGKTTLVDLLCEEMKFETVYEIIEENPYLKKFYEDQDKYAFQTEMFFLTDRCNQMKDIENDYLKEGQHVVADYNLAKSLIFAKKTLNDIDYEKFLKVYNILVEDYIQADLVVIIKADLDTLKKRISMRNRDFEQDIEDSYLLYLIEKYDEYISILNKRNDIRLFVIDGNKYDFVSSTNDREYIIDEIKKILRG